MERIVPGGQSDQRCLREPVTNRDLLCNYSLDLCGWERDAGKGAVDHKAPRKVSLTTLTEEK